MPEVLDPAPTPRTHENRPSVNLEAPKVALAIGAHPDDIEFGCGGTLAKWARGGGSIHHCVLTDGSKGTWDPDEDEKALVHAREEEQRSAAKILGGSAEVSFLRRRDGELQNGESERRDVVELIRRIKPDVVLGHDPWRRYRLHPDHRHAGFLLTDAVVAARDPLFYRGLLTAHRPAVLLLWEADDPDHLEDIEDGFEAKVEALLAHRSQLRSTMGVSGDPPEPVALEEFRHTSGDGRENGGPAGLALAEAFRRLTP